MPVRVRKARLQAASRPWQREAEVRAAEGSAEAAVEDAVRLILRHIGEDPEREGLRLTPTRVLHALESLTRGYSEDPKVAINGAVFSEDEYQEIILCKDLDFYSLCEHHLLPFFGKAHVAYLPNGRILGLSKMARIVDMFSRRLQVQGRLTTQICDALQSVLEPGGVGVVIEATPLCMAMRGVQKQNSSAVTSSLTG